MNLINPPNYKPWPPTCVDRDLYRIATPVGSFHIKVYIFNACINIANPATVLFTKNVILEQLRETN